jgi:hypothetical protein
MSFLRLDGWESFNENKSWVDLLKSQLQSLLLWSSEGLGSNFVRQGVHNDAGEGVCSEGERGRATPFLRLRNQMIGSCGGAIRDWN